MSGDRVVCSMATMSGSAAASPTLGVPVRLSMDSVPSSQYGTNTMAHSAAAVAIDSGAHTRPHAVRAIAVVNKVPTTAFCRGVVKHK